MLQHLFARVGTAVLAAGIAWGSVGSASAAPPRYSGGHAGGHAGGSHASYGGNHYHGGHSNYRPSYSGHSNYRPSYSGHSNYRPSYSGHSNYRPAYSGHSYYRPGYSGHSYYRPGYSYYRPGYGGYGYRYPYSTFSLGVNVGGLGYGYGYPGYYGYPSYSGYYGYPSYGVYSGATTYYAPSYVGNDVAVAPAAPATSYYPPAEQAPAPAASNAHLTVQVPAGARLWIDGQLTAQTGAVRSFETPSLDPGRSYSYKLVAEWVENGQTVTRERTVQFAAGNQAVANLTVP